MRDGEPFAQRSCSVFYDTDNIVEEQQETIRICDDCGGAWKIDSNSDRGRRILAIHIPRAACPTCIGQGRQWYDENRGGAYDRIFLQDRTTDQYLNR